MSEERGEGGKDRDTGKGRRVEGVDSVSNGRNSNSPPLLPSSPLRKEKKRHKNHTKEKVSGEDNCEENDHVIDNEQSTARFQAGFIGPPHAGQHSPTKHAGTLRSLDPL